MDRSYPLTVSSACLSLIISYSLTEFHGLQYTYSRGKFEENLNKIFCIYKILFLYINIVLKKIVCANNFPILKS